jgi:MFS transporter, FHS family, L-fucose permease
MIGRFAGTFIMRYVEPARLLSIYTVVCILLSAVAVFAAGQFVVLALGGLGFFMSIMFPTIFSLGIVGLKEDTKPASSLIVMAIIGGAVFPVIMGKIIDNSGDNIQMGYIVPFVCYFFVLYFGLVGHKVKSV